MVRTRLAATLTWFALLTSSTAVALAQGAWGIDALDQAEDPSLDPPPGDPWSSPQQARRGTRPSSGLVLKERITPHWFDDNSRFWYRNDLAAGGREFILVDARNGTRSPAFDHRRLAAALAKAAGAKVDAAKLPFDVIALADHAKTLRFKFGDTVWKCDLASYECSKAAAADAPVEPSTSPSPRRGFSRGSRGREGRRIGADGRSPDGKWTAFVKDHDIYLRTEGGAEPVRLSFDGKEGLAYGRLSWSPDSKRLIALRIEPGDHKEVYLIQSSPPGGGRARFTARPYPLPGDKFTAYELNIFDIASRKQIKPKVDRIDYDEPWLHWNKDGRHFSYEKIDRGHQRFRVVEVDAQTGETRNLIDETVIDVHLDRTRGERRSEPRQLARQVGRDPLRLRA